MSRRGAILQDYGGNFNPMPLESQLTAAQLGQRQQEFAAHQSQQKQQKSDKEAYDLISGLKIDHIGDNTIDVMTDKQLQGLQDELMDMHLKGATTDQLRLTAQRKLPQISNGHTIAKNKLADINTGITNLGKDYKTGDLAKAKELAIKPMLKDILYFDENGRPKGYKETSTIPERNYVTPLLEDDNLVQWYKPSGNFEKHITSLPTPPISGGYVVRDKNGKKTIRKFTGTGSMFDELIKDDEGDVIGMSPKTQKVSLGNDENGKPIQIDTLPEELQTVALGTPEAEADFRIKFNNHLKEIGIDKSKLDPRALKTYRDGYLWDLINKTNLKGSAFNPVREDLQPLPPRVTVNNRFGSDSDLTINDVYGGIKRAIADPQNDIRLNGKKIGTVMNALDANAQQVVLEFANKIAGDELTKYNNTNTFLVEKPNGEVDVYKVEEDKKPEVLPKNLIGTLPRVAVNLKQQANTKAKAEVVRQGEPDKKQSEPTNKWNKYKRN